MQGLGAIYVPPIPAPEKAVPGDHVPKGLEVKQMEAQTKTVPEEEFPLEIEVEDKVAGPVRRTELQGRHFHRQ